MKSRLTALSLLALSVLATGCGAANPTTASVSTSLGAKGLSGISAPAFMPGPLDGQSTPRSAALRRPLAVIVENYAPDSRPQSGLSKASMVIETLAEYGVTRFMAIYLEHDASKVGPVRSTRMYFDHWAAAFHAILVHVGGNDDAQAALWRLPKVFNIDENRWEKSLTDTGTNLFWRSRQRQAPHNMYVNTAVLRRYAEKNHQDWTYTNAAFLHKAAAGLKHRGHVADIRINFVNPLDPMPEPAYDVEYRYNRASNTYKRFMGGQPHVDALNHAVISPANVVVLRTANAAFDPAAGPTPGSILIPTVGSGPAYYFRDGTVLRGRWVQSDQNAPLRFYDMKGRQVALDQGQTWVEVVPSSSGFSYK